MPSDKHRASHSDSFPQSVMSCGRSKWPHESLSDYGPQAVVSTDQVDCGPLYNRLTKHQPYHEITAPFIIKDNKCKAWSKILYVCAVCHPIWSLSCQTWTNRSGTRAEKVRGASLCLWPTVLCLGTGILSRALSNACLAGEDMSLNGQMWPLLPSYSVWLVSHHVDGSMLSGFGGTQK